jgi:lipoprotein-anchoring transpeptidase ErfK/SrfK
VASCTGAENADRRESLPGAPFVAAQAVTGPPRVLEEETSTIRATTSTGPKKRPGPIERRTVGAVALGDRLLVRNRPKPAASARALPVENPIGQRLVFLVLGRADRSGTRWLKLALPERPNGSAGWVRRRSTKLITLRHRIEIDISEHSLRHYRDAELLQHFSVGVGRAATPTPPGVQFVWARVPQPDPSGPYGSFALGLSGFSPVLLDWPGGGRIAIHGTANPQDRGLDVSHGCIRVFNPQMNRLRRVPLGTPVIIQR